MEAETMIAEAIELIQETAVAAAGAEIIQIEGEDRLVYVHQNGNLVKHEFERPLPRKHTAQALEDLVAAAMFARAQIENARTSDDPRVQDLSIWHSQGAVVALLGDHLRREIVTMKLIVSPVFEKLEAIKNGVSLSQRDFLRLLKHDFYKAGDLADLAAAVAKVKFSSSNESNASIQIGRESLGRQIQLEAVGASAFPEEFSVDYPVYVNPGLSSIEARVVCTLDIDVQNEKFSIQPKPDELLEAYQLVHRVIHQQLWDLVASHSFEGGSPELPAQTPPSKYGCQVFYGTP